MRLTTLLSSLVLQFGVTQAVGITVKLPHDSIEDGTLLKIKRQENLPAIQANTSASAHKYLNDKTRPFAVDGAKIPDVPFNAGESYAGLLPTSVTDESRKQFFWFWPSKNQTVDDEIVIWLTAGYFSSSLYGLLQQAGPFGWGPGTRQPYPNTWTPVNITNVVFIEYPIGVGYNEGNVTAKRQSEFVQEFLGFWQNFVTTFSLQGRKVYFITQNEGGYHVPAIAAAMLDTANSTYFDFRGTLLVSPLITDIDQGLDNFVLPNSYLKEKDGLIGTNDEFLTYIQNISQSCGFEDYLSTHFTYPPKGGPIPLLPLPEDGGPCDAGLPLRGVLSYTNGCSNQFDIADPCGKRSDVLDRPIPGTQPYFNRDDVKAALHVPLSTQWRSIRAPIYSTDVAGVPRGERWPNPTFFNLSKIIDASERTIIITGENDAVNLHQSVELSIQNMTWGGVQGFQTRAWGRFIVDPFNEYVEETFSGLAQLGETHTERKLTYVLIRRAGHNVGTNAPGALFKSVEYLLKRRDDIEGGISFYRTTRAT